jgi:hypothetical protein
MNLRWSSKAPPHYWGEVDKVQRLLRKSISRSSTRKQEVAIAGSSALLWYQKEQRIGPSWKYPGDIDVFVCGDSATEYNNIVKKFIIDAYAVGHRAKKASVYFPSYFSGIKKMEVTYLELTGFSNIISFVRYKDCKNIQEVIDGFDINVCKVIYHIHEKRFEVETEVREYIAAKKAKANGIGFKKKGHPVKAELIRAMKTAKRIEKYSHRGFYFENASGIAFI